MLYTDLESLAIAAANMPLSDCAQKELLSRLIKTYFDAFNNPPAGIIGVGAITYAQDMLIAAQLNKIQDSTL